MHKRRQVFFKTKSYPQRRNDEWQRWWAQNQRHKAEEWRIKEEGNARGKKHVILLSLIFISCFFQDDPEEEEKVLVKLYQVAK